MPSYYYRWNYRAVKCCYCDEVKPAGTMMLHVRQKRGYFSKLVHYDIPCFIAEITAWGERNPFVSTRSGGRKSLGLGQVEKALRNKLLRRYGALKEEEKDCLSFACITEEQIRLDNICAKMDRLKSREKILRQAIGYMGGVPKSWGEFSEKSQVLENLRGKDNDSGDRS